MPAFCAADGTELAYHVHGEGIPLVCVPGGPMRASAYLGDLGGLPAHRQLIMLDLRGTGDSAIPEDTGSYRCDRLVGDVAALQDHLGLDRCDLLGRRALVLVAKRRCGAPCEPESPCSHGAPHPSVAEHREHGRAQRLYFAVLLRWIVAGNQQGSLTRPPAQRGWQNSCW